MRGRKLGEGRLESGPQVANLPHMEKLQDGI